MTSPSHSIRRHLFQLLLVSILPIGLLAGMLLYVHWEAQERQRERSQIESVRLLAAAVDNALDSTAQRLSIFASVWGASPVSEELAYVQAREAVAANPDWLNIVAFRANRTTAFRSDLPFGTELPTMSLTDLWNPVIDERKPLVSDIFISPVRKVPTVAVGVPVVRDGRVTHVLVATLNLRWFDELLTRQGLPEGGVAGVFDRNWKFVARGREGEERRGTDPAQALVADMKQKAEGIGRYTNLNGVAVYTTWSRAQHGWWLAVATPAGPIDNPFWGYLAVFACLWAAALAVAVAFSLSKGRQVAQSLVALQSQAAQLSKGQRLGNLPHSRVAEVDRALAALEEASEVLQLAMAERDRSLDTEREARAAAEAANKAKDEFLAMLGHELRNPLAAITNAASVLQSGRRTPEQVDFAAGVVVRQGQHLKRLIDDLLDVGRVMTGKVMLERQPLDLSASVDHVVQTLRTGGRLQDREVEVRAAPVWVNGDQTRIEQIVTNLLVNAATYTRPGGRIRVEVARDERGALLCVADDGRGIAPEHLERIFELFFQADATVDRTHGGLGIGLTLVKRLVELHGGKIAAHSEGPGRGAEIAVSLPAMAAPERGAVAPAALRHAPQTVLLVEDNADARETLRMLLELHGHTVIAAADGPAALEALRRHRPPVAILDIGLPGMDGYRLAAEIRREAGNGILLIALTGYGTSEDERRARDAGFDRHLTKPVDVAELAAALDPKGRAAVRAA